MLISAVLERQPEDGSATIAQTIKGAWQAEGGSGLKPGETALRPALLRGTWLQEGKAHEPS